METRLIAERDPQSQVAHVQLVFRRGSLLDPPRLPGLAHLAARALLRGTRERSYRELTGAVERLGASLGVRADHDLTVVSASVLARNLDPFLELLQEILTRPAFAPEEIATLQRTIQGELRAGLQDAQELAIRAALRSVFRGTAAERIAEGTLEGVARATAQDVRAFFEAHYGRRDLLVGAVSPFAPEDVSSRLHACIEALPEGSPRAVEMPEPALQGRRAIVVSQDDLSTTPAYVIVPGAGDADPDMPALELANFAFGGDFTARLMQVLRAENGWTYGVSSGYRQILSNRAKPGLFSTYLFPSAEHASLAIPKAVEMLEEYARRGLTEEEFEKAREALGNSYPFQVATAEQRLSLRMRELLTGRPYEGPEQYAARLASLDPARVNEAVARRVRPERMLVVAAGDPASLKPVLGSLPGVESVDVTDLESLGI